MLHSGFQSLDNTGPSASCSSPVPERITHYSRVSSHASTRACIRSEKSAPSFRRARRACARSQLSILRRTLLCVHPGLLRFPLRYVHQSIRCVIPSSIPGSRTTGAVDVNVLYHSLSALASAEVNFWFTCGNDSSLERTG